MNRRQVLALASSSLAAALAGCNSDNSEETPQNDDPGNPTDGQTATPTTPEPTATPTDDGEEGESTPSDVDGEPTQTFDEYIAAVRDADAQAAIALLHEDSKQTEENIENDFSYFSDKEITVVDRSIIPSEETDGVLVRGVLEVTPTGSDSGSTETNRIGIQMALRRGESGKWLIYDARGFQLTDGSQTETDNPSS